MTNHLDYQAIVSSATNHVIMDVDRMITIEQLPCVSYADSVEVNAFLEGARSDADFDFDGPMLRIGVAISLYLRSKLDAVIYLHSRSSK